MVWNIGSANKYESQSAIIPFVALVMPKEWSCDNNATTFLLVGVLRQRKKLTSASDKMCCLYFGVSTNTN
jgi:hypothetical protein